MAKRDNTQQNEPAFEDALDELQEIVSNLEDGTLSLEDSMQQFERGVGLLRTCHDVLEAAEAKIAILTGTDADGNPVTAPFDATATADQTGRKAGRRARSKTNDDAGDD